MTSPKRQRAEQYKIVPATRQHVRAIPGLEQAAAALFPAEDLPAELRYRVTDNDVLRQAQRQGRLWVALDPSGRAVGFALAEVQEDEARLDEVDVHPLHARRGIGTRLVETVIAWAEGRNFPSLSLLTFRHLPWNAPFYERLGFEILEKHELSPGLADILGEEALAGINIDKRVGMRRMLR
ncbi:MAG: GNAT family N-acetyltransferase [Woeseia sp.]